MPELPEVETTVRMLRPELLDQEIRRVAIGDGGARHFNVSAQDVQTKLTGARLKNLSRTGKWMLFDFENAGEKVKAVGHLRMSGRYWAKDVEFDHPHIRFGFELGNGRKIYYLDQRRFGTFHFVNEFNDYPALAKLGPDILHPNFTAKILYEKLQKTKKPIYTALLDQNIVAGLGNIYVNESLNAARIHPLTPANQLTYEQVDLLVEHAIQILNMALKFKGTTLVDKLYTDPEGKTGEFAKMLKVYGKTKDPNVERIKIGGRSVFFDKKLKR